MNKAFQRSRYWVFIRRMERNPVPFKNHPLKDEVLSKIKSGKIVFS